MYLFRKRLGRSKLKSRNIFLNIIVTNIFTHIKS